MNRFLTVALTLGLAVGVAGCDDEFLVTEPQDTISDATFWQTERDFTAAVNATYREVLDADIFYLEGTTDLVYSQKDWVRNHAFAMGFADARHGWAGGVWARLYRGISKANEILTQLDGDHQLSESAESVIRGQALFLRGYFYHELLWLYGEVPIFTSVPTVTEAREASRNSRQEVMDLVLADLTAAAQALPEDWAGSDEGRATEGAALAFKARAALYEASWQEYQEGNAARANELYRIAADAAQAVMELDEYVLHPDYRELFTVAGEGSPEVIFDYAHIRGTAGTNDYDPWNWFAPHSMGGDIDLTPTRALVDLYLMEDGQPVSESPLYDPTPPVIVDGETVTLGMYANRDPRLHATVLVPGAEFNDAVYNPYPGSGTPDAVRNNNFSNTHTGYVQLKYVDPADQASPFDSGINVIRMRYADVLLMYAEAKAELGEIDQSVYDALNEIRDRVDMPHVPQNLSQQELIELIRRERTVELALEGLRLADIRRWAIAEEVMPGQVEGIDVLEGGTIDTLTGAWVRTFNPNRDYLWPIPTSERDLNDNLSQNPGY